MTVSELTNEQLLEFSRPPLIHPYREGERWTKLPSLSKEPLIFDFSLGNGTLYRAVAFFRLHRFFVGLERKGCFFFVCKHAQHPSYVAEKLNLMPGDAANIADWINVQLGIEVEEFGHYYLSF